MRAGRFSNLEWGGRDASDAEGEEGADFGRSPRDDQFYLELADKAYRRGRFETALRYYSRALEFDPNRQEGWVGQVRMLLELGEVSEAKLWAEKGLDVYHDDAELLAATAVAWARLGAIEQAQAFSDAAMTSKGGSPFLWLARGEALLASRGSNHEYCFMKARSAAAGDWFVLLLVARLYARYGNPAQAHEWAKQSAEASSNQPFTWLVMGQIQKALRLDERAVTSFRQAIALDGSCREAHEELRQLGEPSGWRRWVRGLPAFLGFGR